MSKQNILVSLAVVILAQVCILGGMVALAAKPLYTGQEVRVATLPIDPRSLFRGNYARLDYEFSSLPESALEEHGRLRNGEPLYVTLTLGDDGLYEYDSVSLQKPEAGVFIRGRLQNRYGRKRVKYGIEAWFAPKEEALRLERELRDSAVAVLMIDSSGKAALKEIITTEE
jgi:uncharacterized membrane-anchored protein